MLTRASSEQPVLYPFQLKAVLGKNTIPNYHYPFQLKAVLGKNTAPPNSHYPIQLKAVLGKIE